MPELPDVEVYKQYVDATALHEAIVRTHVDSPELLVGTSAQGLGRKLKGRRLEATRRHGKYLFLRLDDSACLVLHFGMTGDLKYYRHDREKPEYTCLLLLFDNGFQLAYTAPRKLGRIAVTEEPEAFIRDHALGPDALSLNLDTFIGLTRQRRRGVKSLLMHQATIAGIGNVYSDEILFRARIHPKHAANKLERGDLEHLFAAMIQVLNSAIDARADPANMPRDFLLPHRKKDGRCPRCQTPLETVKVSGRTAYYCPECQKP